MAQKQAECAGKAEPTMGGKTSDLNEDGGNYGVPQSFLKNVMRHRVDSPARAKDVGQDELEQVPFQQSIDPDDGAKKGRDSKQKLPKNVKSQDIGDQPQIKLQRVSSPEERKEEAQ